MQKDVHTYRRKEKAYKWARIHTERHANILTVIQRDMQNNMKRDIYIVFEQNDKT